jgi:hypothetical protein
MEAPSGSDGVALAAGCGGATDVDFFSTEEDALVAAVSEAAGRVAGSLRVSDGMLAGADSIFLRLPGFRRSLIFPVDCEGRAYSSGKAAISLLKYSWTYMSGMRVEQANNTDLEG